eukprot:GEMP01012344.1.p1 GENE.GEMP01012344.1~~GEMP01012344.1.p1  ORF type:complete len:868 (+),score=145.59 GEMP01012344.1:463-3066(+)
MFVVIVVVISLSGALPTPEVDHAPRLRDREDASHHPPRLRGRSGGGSPYGTTMKDSLQKIENASYNRIEGGTRVQMAQLPRSGNTDEHQEADVGHAGAETTTTASTTTTTSTVTTTQRTTAATTTAASTTEAETSTTTSATTQAATTTTNGTAATTTEVPTMPSPLGVVEHFQPPQCGINDANCARIGCGTKETTCCNFVAMSVCLPCPIIYPDEKHCETFSDDCASRCRICATGYTRSNNGACLGCHANTNSSFCEAAGPPCVWNQTNGMCAGVCASGAGKSVTGCRCGSAAVCQNGETCDPVEEGSCAGPRTISTTTPQQHVKCIPRRPINKCYGKYSNRQCTDTCPYTAVDGQMLCKNGAHCDVGNTVNAPDSSNRTGWGCCDTRDSGGVLECPHDFPFLCAGDVSCIRAYDCHRPAANSNIICPSGNDEIACVNPPSCKQSPCHALIGYDTDGQYADYQRCPIPFDGVECPTTDAPSCKPREASLLCIGTHRGNETVDECSFACPHTSADTFFCRDNERAVLEGGCRRSGILECNQTHPFLCAKFDCVADGDVCDEVRVKGIDGSDCGQEHSGLCVKSFCVDTPIRCQEQYHVALVGHPNTNIVALQTCPLPLAHLDCPPLPPLPITCPVPSLVGIKVCKGADKDNCIVIDACPHRSSSDTLCRNKKSAVKPDSCTQESGGLLQCPADRPFLCAGNTTCVPTKVKCESQGGVIVDRGSSRSCMDPVNPSNIVQCVLAPHCSADHVKCPRDLVTRCPVPLPGLSCDIVIITTSTVTPTGPPLTTTEPALTEEEKTAAAAAARGALSVESGGMMTMLLIVLALVVIVLVGCCLWIFWRRRSRGDADDSEEEEEFEGAEAVGEELL